MAVMHIHGFMRALKVCLTTPLQDVFVTLDNGVGKAKSEIRKGFSSMDLHQHSILLLPSESALTLRKNFNRSAPASQ